MPFFLLLLLPATNSVLTVDIPRARDRGRGGVPPMPMGRTS